MANSGVEFRSPVSELCTVNFFLSLSEHYFKGFMKVFAFFTALFDMQTDITEASMLFKEKKGIKMT